MQQLMQHTQGGRLASVSSRGVVAPGRAGSLRRRLHAVRAAAPGAVPVPAPTVTTKNLDGKKVLIIGGTGRVGASSAAALLRMFPGMQVTVSSRRQASYEAAVAMRPELKAAAFMPVDIEDAQSIQAALVGQDLVVHTAGPFQRTRNHKVLEAAIAGKVPYVDVCDDLPYSEESKELYAEQARAAGVPAIISAGIYPGTSNVMAAHIISIARKEYDEEWKYRTPEPGEGVEPNLLRYSYYTAGSGGAGPTILETSFLLLGEMVTVFKDDEKFELPPISNRRAVDFGPGLGRKGVWLYNLPEVMSAKKYLGVKGVSARFGTDPFFWNWAMWIMARLIPKSKLNDRGFVKWFAKLSDPFVRIVDSKVGEAVAMKVEVDFTKGKNSAGMFVHKALGQSMGNSVAAFAHAVLSGDTEPGVWYPEEKSALLDRRTFLQLAATGCDRFDLNRSAWSLESEPEQIGGLIYW